MVKVLLKIGKPLFYIYKYNIHEVMLSDFAQIQFSHQKYWSWHNFDNQCYRSPEN